VYAVSSFESTLRLALRPAGRTLATQFKEKQKQFIDAKCCAMTMNFDDMTNECVDMSKLRQKAVNGVCVLCSANHLMIQSGSKRKPRSRCKQTLVARPD